MGGADFINVLYSEFLTYDPAQPTWECRDRFFLDPGHMSPMLYAQLALIGRFSIDELKTFRQWGSQHRGHPEKNFERGVENTSGPLGQGHTYAVGAAIAAKLSMRAPVIPASNTKRFTPTSLTEVSKRKSLKAQVVWPDTSDWTTSSCSSTPTKSNSRPKRPM